MNKSNIILGRKIIASVSKLGLRMVYSITNGVKRMIAGELMNELVEIDGMKAHVLRKGTGKPLLWLHGEEGNPEWNPMLDALSRSFDVIAPEHPGFGSSDRPEWLTDFEDLVYYYRAFLDTFGIEKAYIAGHSLGGWLAAEFAASQTHRVEKLILAAPEGLWAEGLPKTDTFLLSQQELADHMFYDESLKERQKELFRDPEAQAAIIRNRVGHTRLAWDRYYNPKFNRILKWVQVPTMIIWGEQDRIIPAEYAKVFAELIPGSRIQLLKHCGHYPHIEKTDEFVRAVENFLKDRNGQSAAGGD